MIASDECNICHVVQLILHSTNYRKWLKRHKKVLFLQHVHIHVLKIKSTIIRYVKCFVPGISSRKNLFKEIVSVNSNAPGRSTSFEQMLVGSDEIYLQNKKFKRSSYNDLMKNKSK